MLHPDQISMPQITESKDRNSHFVDQFGKINQIKEIGTTGETTETNGHPCQDQTIRMIIAGKGQNKQSTITGNTPTITHIKNTNSKADNIPSNHTGENLNSNIGSKEQNLKMVMETYNCLGFSRTADYILERLINCDIMGLTETWLRPNELHSIESALKNHPKFKNDHDKYKVFSKSGMTDIESDYSGRPFGGVSMVIKSSKQFNCKEIEILSDRILTVGLYDIDCNPLQIICCVYMPFYNGKSDQTDLYKEAIDALQAVVDQYASIAPIKIIGDFNTQLPTSQKMV